MSEVDKAIGFRVAIARELHGVTQATLCKKVGVTRSQLANMEAGKSTWSVRQLLAVARALKLRPERLLRTANDE